MAAVTGKSTQAPEDTDESDGDDVDISDASQEDDAAEGDWDRALPHFSTRPRTQRHRLLDNGHASSHSTGGASPGKAFPVCAAGARCKRCN